MSDLIISPDVLNLQKDLCRCCHSEGVFMSLFSSYFWLDDEEIAYAVTLRECFGIDLIQVIGSVGNMLCGICDVCIKKLQEARQFKQQVMSCETRLKDMYLRKSSLDSFVKVEPLYLDESERIPRKRSNSSGSKTPTRKLSTSRKSKQMAVSEKPQIKTEETLDPVFHCKIEFGDDDNLEKCDKSVLSNDKDKHLETDDDDSRPLCDHVIKDKKDKDGVQTSTDGDETKPSTNQITILATVDEGNVLKPGTSQVSETVKATDQNKSKKTHLFGGKRPKRRFTMLRKKKKFDSIEIAAENNDIKKETKKETKKECNKATKKETTNKKQGTNAVPPRPHLGIGVDYDRIGSIFQCCRCEKKYKSMNGIRQHAEIFHFNMSIYTCPEANCAKKFQHIVRFKKHKLEEHSIDERFKCNACDAAYYKRDQLNHHINSFHMLGEKFKCDVCDYESYSKTFLNRHKILHATVKEHKCSYCGKAFLRSKTLICHERIHTGDKRKACKECGQAFVQKASLNYHMAKYHPGVSF